MTYAEFVAECQKKQRSYVMAERAKMRRAAHGWRRYEELMRGLQLHPLTGMEIVERQLQLRQMLEDIPLSHGDTPAMRGAFEMHKDTTP